MHRSERFKLAVYIILLATLTVLVGKIIYRPSVPNAFLFAYGIAVTSIILLLFYYAFHRYKDPALIGSFLPRKKKPLVSCMVAVRNEEHIIADCIKSILAQTYGRMEIIIVNDASTDSTKDVLRQFTKQGVKVINLKQNFGKKKALAQAMLGAKGEIFVFTDSDSVLAPDAVEKVVDAFNLDPLIGAVAGHCRALNAQTNLLTRIQDSWHEGQFSIRKAFESVFGAVTCVSGPLAGFRREAIFNFIPAWENDSFLGKEFRFATDRTLTGFVLGARSMGAHLKRKYANSPFVTRENHPLRDWRVVYAKSARAWTKVPETFGAFLRQQVRWKKSFLRNMFFTGKFYWRRPFLPALFYYLHILFVFSGPIIAFRYLVYLPYKGNLLSALLYVAGILFVGFMFGLAYKVESRDHKWVYRPLMSLTSTLVLVWLIFYAMFTIRRSTWRRG